MSTPTQERQVSGPAGLATRFPVAVFLTMAIGLSYPLVSLAIMAEYRVIPGKSLPSRIGLDMERAASALLVASLVVATFVTTALHGGRPAMRVLLRRMRRWASRSCGGW